MKAICLCLLCLLFYATPTTAQPAEQCLENISAAIETGNSAAFTKLVDMDAIFNQGMNVFLEQAVNPENAASIPPMLAIMLTQAANQPTVRSLLLQEVRSFVLNGIATGAFAGKKLSATQQQGLLAPLFAQASIGRKEIRSLGKPVADDANGWFLPFNVHDFGNGNNYAIVGHFTQGDKGVRLTGIENLEQIFAQIKKEALGQEENLAAPEPQNK